MKPSFTRLLLVPLALGFSCAAWLALPAADSAALNALVQLLAQVDDSAVQLDVLKGMHEGLRGRRNLKMPAGWGDVYAKLQASRNAEIREKATNLALMFGDPRAVETLRKVLIDGASKPARRQEVLAVLVEAQTPGLAATLHKLLDDAALRGAAVRALAAYDDSATPREILERYAAFKDAEKIDAVNALAARSAYAVALLDAVEQGTVPRGDISAYTARQLQAFGDKRISERLAKVWGASRQTSKEKAALIAKYKGLLSSEYMADANVASGRRVYQRACASCHRLYGEGGQVGPDLTGSNRKNLDYILENVLDPSALINRDYKLTLILTEDGRLLSGIIAEQNDAAVTIQTVNQRVVLPRPDIERMQASDVSMMPEGVLDKLGNEEIRDLVAYLRTESQVQQAEESGNANKR
jgi:putative heme-binding domain-containing protein